MENFVNLRAKEEDKAFYDQILNEFEPISDDLYVFFHATQNKRCFMTYSYFHSYREHFKDDFNLSFLQKKLSDYQEVIRRVLDYYFFELTPEEQSDCLQSNVKLFRVIKSSKYLDTEKSRLYEFFMDPIPYIQKLQYELLAKEVQLATYYEKRYDRIIKEFGDLTLDFLIEQLKIWRDFSFIKNEGFQLYVSFSLINHMCINFASTVDGGVGLLGIDYRKTVEEAASRKNDVSLDDFGAAVSEKNRVKMLDLMMEKGEITCKDLEREFNFSGSTAYHHLTILIKGGVVKTRNEGKTILYSINANQLLAVIDVLNKYINKGDH